MTLDQFYTLFAQWEHEVRRCWRAQDDLEQSAHQQATETEEILYFLGHWDLLAGLQGLLRLRSFLPFFRQDLAPAVRDRLQQRLQEAGYPDVTPDLVDAFYQAWRQEFAARARAQLTPETRFTLTLRGQTVVRTREEKEGSGAVPVP
jgi:hypothetical protein